MLTEDESKELARLQAKSREGNSPKPERETCVLTNPEGHSVEVPIDSDVARHFLKENFDLDIDKPASEGDKEIRKLENE